MLGQKRGLFSLDPFGHSVASLVVVRNAGTGVKLAHFFLVSQIIIGHLATGAWPVNAGARLVGYLYLYLTAILSRFVLLK